MAKSGEAMSDGSYPIKDEEDLKNAIRAVGRGGASHNGIRKHIMARAKALELSNLIPENWAEDGSITTDSKAAGDLEHRHAAYTGAHSHSHTADGSQGGDATHSHEHTHDGDSAHSHSHAEANAKPKQGLEWRKKKAKELRGSERRTFALNRVELRDNPDGTLHLSGYASVTGTPYDMGWYSESIKRGAFGKTLAENPDVQLLINHEGLPIARTGQNMTLSEDNTGLRVEADLDPDDPDVQRLAPKMRAGLIDQMSFAFRAVRQSWNEDYTDREITETDIHRGDVSVVNQGANPATSVSIRSEDAALALRRIGPLAVFEAFLELRRFSAIPKEQRVGMTLSAATTEVLTQVLNLVAAADEAVDEAQPLLADLLGVPNPDEDDESNGAGTSDEDEGDEHLSLPVFDRSAERARLEALRYPDRRAA
jgi:hypothetical protein